MSSYIVDATNISVEECIGTLPDAKEPSLGRNWPRGSVVDLQKADADSLLAAKAVIPVMAAVLPSAPQPKETKEDEVAEEEPKLAAPAHSHTKQKK